MSSYQEPTTRSFTKRSERTKTTLSTYLFQRAWSRRLDARGPRAAGLGRALGGQRGARARTPPAAIGRRRSHSELTRQGSRSLAPPASFSPRLARKAGNVELEQRTLRSTATRDSVPPHAKPREPMCSKEAGFVFPHAGRGKSWRAESRLAAGTRY